MYAVSYVEQVIFLSVLYLCLSNQIPKVGSFKYTRDVIAQLQAETHALIAKHGGNVAIAEIVEYLAAKVFADAGSQLPRRPGTPSRAQPGGGTPTLSAVPDGHMMLTLSSEYCEDDLQEKKL